MKITNRNNIPTTIADAMAKAQARYSKGESWMSVTGLQRPPRISILSKKNWNKLEEDVSDSVWKLFGTTMHNILEDGESSSNSLIKEERFFGDFLGKKISGAVDLQEITDFGIEIGDYKVTKAISVMKNSFSIPSWTQQLNAYAELCQVNKGLPITRLYICAFVRDHSPREAERNPEYPQSPIHILEIDRWQENSGLLGLKIRCECTRRLNSLTKLLVTHHLAREKIDGSEEINGQSKHLLIARELKRFSLLKMKLLLTLAKIPNG